MNVSHLMKILITAEGVFLLDMAFLVREWQVLKGRSVVVDVALIVSVAVYLYTPRILSC